MNAPATTTTAPFAPTSVARSDFPGWLPPMLVKELRQGLRTKGFIGTFIAFHALMALVMLGAVTSATSTNAGVRAMTMTTTNGFFWVLLSLQLLLLTPGRALGGLQMESESRTLDLLLLTKLDAWRIVTGKWLSLVAQALLLLTAMLPYGIVRYFAGSVDLVSDARVCAGLLGGSALLTAAGLWGAGMGKAFRVLAVLLAVFGSSVGNSFLAAISRGGGGPFGVAPSGGVVGLIWFDAALLLVFFLVAAVRNIAPIAENHAVLARALPLLALAAVPVGMVLGLNAVAVRGELVFAGALLVIVGAVEMANFRRPMLVHTRPWRQRAALPRVVFRMALPGWPSALLYLTGAAMLWVFCALVIDVVHSNTVQFAWPAVLGLAAIAFPAVLMAFFVRMPRAAGGVYGLFLATGVICAVFGMTLPMGYAKLEWLRDVAAVLPVSSFVLAVFSDPPSVPFLIVQGLVAVAVLAAGWWKARDYWHALALLEQRDDAEPT